MPMRDAPVRVILRACVRPSIQNVPAGWLALWLPMPWPRRRSSRTSSGRCNARSPTRKNVAFAARVEQSRIARVSPTAVVDGQPRDPGSSVGKRDSTGENRRERRGLQHAPPARGVAGEHRGQVDPGAEAPPRPRDQRLRGQQARPTRSAGWRGGRCRAVQIRCRRHRRIMPRHYLRVFPGHPARTQPRSRRPAAHPVAARSPSRGCCS